MTHTSVRAGAGVTAAIGLTVALTGFVSAATPAGWLDPSFGSRGITIIAGGYPAGDRRADAAVAVSASGRTYVLAYHERADGLLAKLTVTAYTGSGRTISTFHGGRPIVIAEDPDTAECCGSIGPFPTTDGGVEAGFAVFGGSAVMKYTATGRPDTRYGTNGRALIADDAFSTTRLPGGSIRSLTVDVFGDPSEPPVGFLAGLTPDGAPDTRVGAGGRRTLSMPVSRLASDAQGRLYIVGRSPDLASDLAVYRMSSSGDTDTTWGSAGSTRIPLAGGTSPPANTILVAPSGAVFVVSARSSPTTGRPQVTISKLTAAGALDPAFGSGGSLIVPAPSGSSRFGALAVDANGRLLLSFVDRGAKLQPYLARFDGATGALDPAFGRGGLVPVANLVVSIAPTADGKVLTVSRTAHDGTFTLFLARRFD
jgi:uncharacterized delta-60 repeat protein